MLERLQVKVVCPVYFIYIEHPGVKKHLFPLFFVYLCKLYFFISCRKYSAMTPGGMSKDLAGFKMPGLKETQTKS